MSNLYKYPNKNTGFKLSSFLKAVLLITVIFTFVTSCDDEPSMAPEKSSKDRIPELSATSQEMQLDQANFNNTAVEFSWSPGSNHGTNSAVDYSLQFDRKGNNFESAVSISLGRDVYSKSYSVEEFNTLLRQELNVEAGSSATIEARIKSATADTTVDPDFSNTVELNVTPYEPVSTTLYMIGSAAPNGWDANNATELQQSSDVPFVFTYEGELSTGEFKFITTLGQFLPSYNKGENSSKLFHRTEESQPDEPFTVDEAGPYRITVNLVNLTIDIQKAEGPKYSKLWLIGDAAPNGWDLDNAELMRQDPGDPYVFDFNAELSEGEFKIATAKSFDAPFYRPTENHPDLSNQEVQLSAGEPDHKWYISEPGPYKITFNMREMTISIEKFTPYDQIWMVGSAAPSGWNIDNPTEMQADPNNEYVFTYEGQLNSGEFKFSVDTGAWDVDYFMPGVQHQPLDSTYVRFIPNGSPDLKWNVTEPGNYSIELNQLKETIHITQQ